MTLPVKELETLRQSEIRLSKMNAELEAFVAQQTEEIRRTNRDLINALQELRDSERMRDTFVSALTHDLRTPLIGHKRALEILDQRRDELPEELAELVERMALGNNDLLHMVNQLLEMYHLESGQVDLMQQPHALRGMVAAAMAELAVLANAREIRFFNDIPADLPLIQVDAGQFHRVLMNMLGNAIKHLPVGAELRVSVKQAAGEVLISIQDNGPGIPGEMQEHLFSRYATPAARRKLGSGLGLYSCKLILNLHGGDITLNADAAEGAQFIIRLPHTESDSEQVTYGKGGDA